MKEIFNRLIEHKTLSREEAKKALQSIAANECNNSQIASFLTIFMMRSITVDELAGFRDALLELCTPIDLSAYDPIDLCGTGGDNKNTFNISTLSSFVVAGVGYKVAKHGNYGVSSACGSSNVMEYLGVKFTNDAGVLKKQIEEAGICFLHAPLFHAATKNVGPVRKELGLKTFFNMLGPMVNPAFPKKQTVGVFSLELARLYNYLYQSTDKKYIIVHSLDVYDEISLTGPFKIISNQGEQILQPEDLNLETCTPESIEGGETIEDSAKTFITVLEGKGTKQQNNVIFANAGMAVFCADGKLSLTDAVEVAKESLLSGQALKSFKKFIA